MPSVRDIRRRIRSVENTAKITKAMSMIAASKMRRAQEMALRGRPYSERMRSLLADLAAQPHDEDMLHPLLQRRDPEKTSVVLITPDRGLTGGLHSKINRAAAQFILDQPGSARIVAVGRKGRDFMVRSGQDVQAEFSDLGDRPTLLDITPITRIVIDDYTEGRTDAVHVVYPDFRSTTLQMPIVFIGVRGQGMSQVAEQVNDYKRAWKDAGHEGPADVSLRVPVFVADSKEEALSVPEESFMKQFRRLGAQLASSVTRAGTDPREQRAERGEELAGTDLGRGAEGEGGGGNARDGYRAAPQDEGNPEPVRRGRRVERRRVDSGGEDSPLAAAVVRER